MATKWKTLSTWRPLLWLAGVALALALSLKSDLSCLRWASDLSQQGSPPPAVDATSPTGYTLGQRHFLGSHGRGESYRWIASAQDFFASGPLVAGTYESDTVPEGRPRLAPRLYTAWVAALAWCGHVVTGQPTPLAVEQTALWEPVLSHALALLAAVTFVWRRYGRTSAVLTGLFFAVCPLVAGQFLPGVLTTGTWALLFAAYALASSLPLARDPRSGGPFSARSALAASLALWLDPSIGFPSVLIAAAVGAGTMFTSKTPLPCLRWSLIGAAATLVAWLVDRSPATLAAGELRYVHPLYAGAWLGLGLALDGIQNLRTPKRRNLRLAEIGAALLLLAPLAYAQIAHGYKGWLYPSATITRLTSLDETIVFGTALDWLARASILEVVLVSAPMLAAAGLLAGAWLPRRAANAASALPAAILLVGVVMFAFFRVRWVLVGTLVALPLIWQQASALSLIARRGLLGGFAVFLLGLFWWGTALPPALQRPTAETPPSAADSEALVYRHFAHWLASHNPGQKVSALAPPELSDSLVFHGGARVLMSTAWESYPGQIAASRILSAPEASEAEAVLQSREITHVILTSWDSVLPLLVRQPTGSDQDSLYARLQRWLYPPYLRPIPYRLPSFPAYADQKLVVFRVTAPQDEALSLSRLAEYFVEMERSEPAALAAGVLSQAYADDPNAAIARALVYAQAKKSADFDRALTRLASDATSGPPCSSWDRRVQRAIVLALGNRRDLARSEVAACAAGASREDLFELTPLQAYRLQTLMKRFQATFRDDALSQILASLSAGYSPQASR